MWCVPAHCCPRGKPKLSEAVLLKAMKLLQHVTLSRDLIRDGTSQDLIDANPFTDHIHAHAIHDLSCRTRVKEMQINTYYVKKLQDVHKPEENKQKCLSYAHETIFFFRGSFNAAVMKVLTLSLSSWSPGRCGPPSSSSPRPPAKTEQTQGVTD